MARRNPLSSGAKIALGVVVLAAVGGVGYAVYKKTQANKALPGGGGSSPPNPSPTTINITSQPTSAIAAHVGDTIVVTGSGWVAPASATGGVQYLGQSGTSFSFKVTGPGGIGITPNISSGQFVPFVAAVSVS